MIGGDDGLITSHTHTRTYPHTLTHLSVMIGSIRVIVCVCEDESPNECNSYYEALMINVAYVFTIHQCFVAFSVLLVSCHCSSIDHSVW